MIVKFSLNLTLQNKGVGGAADVDLLHVVVVNGLVADDRAGDLGGSGDGPGHAHCAGSHLVKVQVCGCRDSCIGRVVLG